MADLRRQEENLGTPRRVRADPREVISLKNRGVAVRDIARAIHLSVVDRLATMLVRLGHGDHVVFSGGVANNPFVVQALERKLGVPVLVPHNPTIIGALGAALHAEG